jgi:hypothetical protein
MAYPCPRCDGRVKRIANSENSEKLLRFGVVGTLIAFAVGDFTCRGCHAIMPRTEFPPNVRFRMSLISIFMLAGAIGVLALFVGWVAHFLL